MNKTLIMIPAYNEEPNLGALLDQLLAVAPENSHILVIDDGSTDRTVQVARERGVDVISQVYNMGYGSALQLGYKFATCNGYDLVFQMDADGQHDAQNIERMRRIMEQDGAPDILIGSRFLEGSESFRVSSVRRLAIGLFRMIIRRMSKMTITDPTSGLQALKRSAFSFYAQYQNFDYDYPDINMIVQMGYNGYTLREFPAVMHARQFGQAMHSGIWKPFVYMIVMMLSTINVYFRRKRRRAA
ncbi:MAG: glycosyltransferase family 2 protein [Christensenellales bacterium]|jgi:glycosyltransferase involved in cell wall biosynthesis